MRCTTPDCRRLVHISPAPGSRRPSLFVLRYNARPIRQGAMRPPAATTPTHPMSARRLYRISFVSQGKVYEIYARSVAQGTLFGFVEVEKLVFGERSTVVLDPSEERIKSEFQGVRRSYLPMHSILRIDEVEKEGVSKISKAEGGNVAQFPFPVYTPGNRSDGGD
jgi:hypothetical protein